MAMLTITTVPATTVSRGMVQVTARTRATTDKATGKKTEISADQRSRSITIPELTPAVSTKYMDLICSALYEAAKQQLGQQWADDPQIQQTSTELYTENALLAFATRESEGKKLNSAAIIAWFNNSEIKKTLAAKANAKQMTRFVEELENVAAPVPNYSEEKALKRITTLGTHDADLENEVCQQIIAKLQRLVTRIQAERAKLGDVEELDA